MNVTASFKWEGREFTDIPVINPGGWFGAAWLIAVQLGYDASLFIVEADSVSDAIDEFVESEHGHLVQIEDADGGDYGFKCGPGDIIGGKAIDHDCWINLKGEEIQKELMEPYVSGNGVHADIDNLMIYGDEGVRHGRGVPFKCRYHAEGLPAKGINPLNFEAWLNWKESK